MKYVKSCHFYHRGHGEHRGKNILCCPHMKSFVGSRGGFSKEPLAAGGKDTKILERERYLW
jgi:hypothetical protein